MATFTFGYQAGDGTGTDVGVGSGLTSVFENDTGLILYVDRIDLLNVSFTSVTSIQMGLYSVIGGIDEPWRQLSLSDILSTLTIGSNTFTLPAPISVGPGEKVAVQVSYSGSLDCDGITTPAPSGEYAASGIFKDPYDFSSYTSRVLPVLLYGSDTGPGTVTDLRSPEVFNEPASGGVPETKVPAFFNEPASGGNPLVRVAEFFDEPLTGAIPLVRVAEFFTEVLHLVLPEPYMLTTPFPGFGNSSVNPAVPAAADPFNSGLPGLGWSVHKIPSFNTNVDESASANEIATSLTEFPRWKYELTYEYLEDSSGALSSLKKILGFFLSARGRFQTWLFKDPDDYLVSNGICGTTDGVTTQFYLCRTLGDFIEPVGQVDSENTINLYLSVSENGSVPASPGPYTITVANSANFVEDLGVTDAGVPLVKVSGAPAAGQYSVVAGVYTFSPAQETDAVIITYRYLLDSSLYTITMPNKVVFDAAPGVGTLSGDFQFYFVCRFLDDEQDYEKFADRLWSLNTVEFRSVLQQ